MTMMISLRRCDDDAGLEISHEHDGSGGVNFEHRHIDDVVKGAQSPFYVVYVLRKDV